MSLRPIGAEAFDPSTRSLPQSPVAHSDALAELARLVGQQDPFRPAVPAGPVPAAPEAAFASEADFAAFDARFTGGPASDEVRAADVPPPPAANERDRPKLRYPTISVREQRRPEQSPDAWAQDAGDHPDAADTVPPVVVDEAARPASGGSSRTLVVLAAVVVLTAGGLGASFLARPSGAAAVASGAAAPTIMAATGPSKVQPETSATGADAPSEPSTLLDKNNNDGTAAAKVVNTVEQPVDLAQAIKPAAPEVAADTPPATPSGAFPEPRKVKTVLVRPDGSIIAETTAPADTVPAPGTDQSSLAFDPRTSLPVMAATAPPAAPSADAAPVVPPKAKPSHAAAPKPAASTTQDGTAQARTTVATPKAKPVAHAPAKPKPAAVADATPTATTPPDQTPAAPDAAAATGGKFAIQLGAAPSEAEGQTTATRLAAKYDLGGAKPAVVKAEAGGKTVYRIRVGHLSQDEAKAMCAKVTAAGGGCFVAR